MAGRMPPTSQLDWLISTTAMIVLFWSRAKRDLLKSFGWGIGHTISCVLAAIDGAISPPAPYHLSAGAGRIRTISTAQDPLHFPGIGSRLCCLSVAGEIKGRRYDSL